MNTQKVTTVIAVLALMIGVANIIKSLRGGARVNPHAIDARIKKLENNFRTVMEQLPKIKRYGTMGVNEELGLKSDRQEELARLRKRVNDLGDKKLSDKDMQDEKFLSELYDSFQSARDSRDARAKMIQASQDQHRMDADRYDAGLSDLYQQAMGYLDGDARPRRYGELSEEEKKICDGALEQMVEEYPDAYATGMAIADRALNAAAEMNTVDVEAYYNVLAGNEKFSTLVTDQGVQAVPSLQSYLVRSYISDGKTGEAKVLLNDLSNDANTTYVADRGASGEPVWRSSSEVVSELNGALNGGGSSQQFPGNGVGESTGAPKPPQ